MKGSEKPRKLSTKKAQTTLKERRAAKGAANVARRSDPLMALGDGRSVSAAGLASSPSIISVC